MLKDPNATQAQINEAKKNLDNARKALDTYNTDIAKLKASVDKHGSTEGPAATEGTQTSDAYRNASDPHFMKEQDGKLVPDDDKNKKAAEDKKAYDEALTKAQELLKKHDSDDTPQDAKPTQADIDAALDALDKARTKLDTYKTDTAKLDEEAKKSTAEGVTQPTAGSFEDSPEFKNAKAKTSDGNENADVTAYKTALANARKLVNDAKDASKKTASVQRSSRLTMLLMLLKQLRSKLKTTTRPILSR